MNNIISKATEYISGIVRPQKRRLLFCSTCLEVLLGCFRSFLVFLVRHCLFWLVTAYFRLFRLLQMTTLQNGLTCKFTKYEVYVTYFLFYKIGQVLLQSRIGITEWDNFYHKIGEGIEKWGQSLQSRIVQRLAIFDSHGCRSIVKILISQF